MAIAYHAMVRIGSPSLRSIGRVAYGMLRALHFRSFGTLFFVTSCGSRTALPVESTYLGISDVSGGSESAAMGSPVNDGGDTGCSHEGSAVPIYLIDDSKMLLSFSPVTASISAIGVVACPTGAGPVAIAFAVDQARVGYLVYSESGVEHPYRLDTGTAACAPVSNASNAAAPTNNILPNGLAFVGTPGGTGERLYALEQSADASTYLATYLATINPGTFVDTLQARTLTDDINIVSPTCEVRPELCSGVGQLFGDGAGHLWEVRPGISKFSTRAWSVDLTSGAVSEQWQQLNLDGHIPLSAAASWGGDLYLFVGTIDGGLGSSDILRFCPRSGSYSVVASWPHSIVLAATPTSAPTN